MVAAKMGKSFGKVDWDTPGIRVLKVERKFNRRAGFTIDLMPFSPRQSRALFIIATRQKVQTDHEAQGTGNFQEPGQKSKDPDPEGPVLT